MRRLHLTLVAATLGMTLGASVATAQETLMLSVCQDGLNGTASQTAEDMGRFLSGTWQMSAAGTGFTQGTNTMPVTLRWDDASQTLRMEGGGGSVVLNPVSFTVDDDGEEQLDAPFDMSVEALTPSNLSQEDAAIVTECDRPARYYWERGSGAQRSWGGLLFYFNDNATGFMANSAGGTRNVLLAR